jgi:dCTP deaminase
MADKTKHLKTLVSQPSLGAVTYQAIGLLHELERITDEEYPGQACKIRDVLLSIIEYILIQLDKLHPRNPSRPLTEEECKRTLALARILQEIFSYIRYLRASSPHSTPPAIQLALTQLTDLYFPKDTNGEPVCLVRPQWKYNFVYVQITRKLGDLISSAIDPEGELGATCSAEILPALWRLRLERLRKEADITGVPLPVAAPPKQLAILSFPGLDTQDTLLYPILGHELGHFIDFSYDPILHLRDDVRKNADIALESVERILETHKVPIQNAVSVRSDLVKRTYICLREILADLLAVRMLGFSFFAAQAEFLKTLAPWPGARIEPSGYPGVRYRLGIVFEHLCSGDSGHNPKAFLSSAGRSHEAAAHCLLKYFDMWAKRLDDSQQIRHRKPLLRSHFEDDLTLLVERVVKNCLPELQKIARHVIPDDKAARLSYRFFERVERLKADLPPSCSPEIQHSFSEILSAAWAFQIIYGEPAEHGRQTISSKFEEYSKNCRLTLKAIELHSLQVRARPFEGRQKLSRGSSKVGGMAAKGVICAPQLRKRLQLPITHAKHLSCVPLNPSAIQSASLDIHLGHWFTVARRSKLPSLRLGGDFDEKLLRRIGREEIFVPEGKTFLIHPGDLVLGATLEFLALPGDLMAFVEGRSGTGRMGLFVATASKIAPGFHGVIVLELANAGTLPLELSPGIPIAQLVFQTMTHSVPKDDLYHGKYYCQIKP